MKKIIFSLTLVSVLSSQAYALDLDRLIGAVAPMVRETETPAFDRSLREESARVNKSKAKKITPVKKQLTLQQEIDRRRRARDKAIEEQGYMVFSLSGAAE